MTLSQSIREVDSDRRISMDAGIAFIVATAASLASTPFLPDLKTADYLAGLSDHAGGITSGVLLLFVAALASAGIAVAMYPVMKRSSPALALASVVFRTIEAVMYLVAATYLLVLLSLSKSYLGSDDATRAVLRVTADMVRSAREHTGLAGVLAFCIGGMAYYLLFFQSLLLPRWLSGFGIAAVLAMFVACLLAVFSDGPITSYVYLAAPILVQEMVMAVWLIVRGFNSSAPVSAS